MLPLLEQFFSKVYAIDTDPRTALGFLDLWYRDKRTVPPAIRMLNDVISAEIRPESIDLLLALDVLEHIPDLDPYFQRFSELLKPDGVIVVSGPTENLLYRIGRGIVGFSGHYHLRDIASISSAMSRFFEVKTLKKLYPAAPLFWILEARKPNAGSRQ
jgi:2-polyprenyl-3-methyl-5-hydroxy-6-metoxy-1,4-benzoquinol methylase